MAPPINAEPRSERCRAFTCCHWKLEMRSSATGGLSRLLRPPRNDGLRALTTKNEHWVNIWREYGQNRVVFWQSSFGLYPRQLGLRGFIWTLWWFICSWMGESFLPQLLGALQLQGPSCPFATVDMCGCFVTLPTIHVFFPAPPPPC